MSLSNRMYSLPDKLIQQIRNLIVINIVEVDKRCYQLLDGRHPGTTGSTGDNLEFRGIMQALADYFTSQFFEITTVLDFHEPVPAQKSAVVKFVYVGFRKSYYTRYRFGRREYAG